jgi:hypothetical protein
LNRPVFIWPRENEEVADPFAWEAKILERIGMSEEILHTIDELFRLFLQIRTSAGQKSWLGSEVGSPEVLKTDGVRDGF